MASKVSIVINVNGRADERIVEPMRHLADFQRTDLGLTGTHIGCEQGVCGQCTVLVDGQAIKSCLMFAVQAEGLEVTTVEALAPHKGLSQLQQDFKDAHALQCGFCTPAFLMTTTALATRGEQLSHDQIRGELAGVLCRCTGYEAIVTAVEKYLIAAREELHG